MALISPTYPTIGDPNATEDPDVLNLLTTIINTINGNLDSTNIVSTYGATYMPWNQDIDVFLTPATQTTWNTITPNAGDVHGARLDSATASGSVIGWDVILAAGTWTFTLLHVTANNRGIYTVALDAVSQGTIDGYNAGGATNVVSTIAGIVVATSGKKRLTLTMSTKNASSSNFRGAIQAVGFRRTA